MNNKYIVKSNCIEKGLVVNALPEETGLTYVGFQVYCIGRGEILQQQSNEKELCIVVLSGTVNIKTRDLEYLKIGERQTIFERIPPYSIYVSKNDFCIIEGVSDKVEIAVCSSSSKGSFPSRLIRPKDMDVEERGSGNTKRYIHNILPEQKNADSLLVVEVYTPEGNWSSYPPHKHDTLNLPEESYLEETYYHRINPEQGFAFQRIYTDDLSINEAITVSNGDVIIVPRGYHPVAASPGYDLYYLNVMAGPERTWKFQNDKKHELAMKK